MSTSTKTESAAPTTRGPPEFATPRRPIEAHPAKASVWSQHILAGGKRRAATNCRIRLSNRSSAGLRPACGACPRCAAGRAARRANWTQDPIFRVA
jgi:hypothetical protein